MAYLSLQISLHIEKLCISTFIYLWIYVCFYCTLHGVLYYIPTMRIALNHMRAAVSHRTANPCHVYIGVNVCCDGHIYCTEGAVSSPHAPCHPSVHQEVEPVHASAVIGGQEVAPWPSVSDLRKGFESVEGWLLFKKLVKDMRDLLTAGCWLLALTFNNVLMNMCMQ